MMVVMMAVMMVVMMAIDGQKLVIMIPIPSLSTSPKRSALRTTMAHDTSGDVTAL